MYMRVVILVVSAVLILSLAQAASAVEVQYGVAQCSNGQQITFGISFTTTPVVVASAQNVTAVSACAANVTATRFNIWLHDDAGNSVSSAWVQWIAFVPDAAKGVLGGTMSANDMQNVSFPAMSSVPVIVTNARVGSGRAVNACAVNNANNGFTVAIRDSNNAAVRNATLSWMAVVPSAQNGFKGDVATRSNGANVTCAAFELGPAYVCSAQDASQPMSAAAANNRNNGFKLVLTKHDGSSGSGWTQWLGYGSPPPKLYAIISGGENTGNPYYDWYWAATTGMYDVLKNRYGVSDSRIIFLFCDTHGSDSRVDGVSTKTNVQNAFTTLKGLMKPDDRLFCYFVGHGLYTGGKSTYDTVGVDITDAEMNTYRQGLPSNQTFVFTQCRSGHFCNALAAQGTVVITSCRYDEDNYKAFAEPIRDALNMVAGADANNDGLVSIGEAYNYARANVVQQYAGASLLEHCQSEDNGDGTSSYCALPCSGHGTLALSRFLR